MNPPSDNPWLRRFARQQGAQPEPSELSDSPPDEAPLQIAPEQAPRPRLLATAAKEVPQMLARPRASWSLRGVALFVISALFAAFLAASVDYWFTHERPVPPTRPLSVLKPIRQALPTPPSPPLAVDAASLHVTSIGLGTIPLAVVNGQQLAEGDWLELRTTQGVAALRVAGIEDGVVHFRYAGRTIDATFDSTSAGKATR